MDDESLIIIDTVLEHSRKPLTNENLDNLISIVSELLDDIIKRAKK